MGPRSTCAEVNVPRAMEKAVVAMDKLAYGDRNRVADGLAGTVSDIRGASAWTKADGDCLVITDMDCEELALKVDLAGRIDVEEETGAAVGAGRGLSEDKGSPDGEKGGFESEGEGE